ncbi:hypothetical protein [Luteolibacter soli]|uniref:Sigma-70 family RNA polymerase sigma factor n=1 Tax=Luteolibacter soli TaxID=3135280 RepID=A0ABU9B5X4_9BACT
MNFSPKTMISVVNICPCLMHFLRESRSDSDQRFFTELYRSLATRVLKSAPRAESLDGKGESLFHKEVREAILDNFVKLLMSDREGYSEYLDFYEIRFDSAVACMRDSAQRQIRRAHKRLVPIGDPDSGELSSAVEASAGTFDPFSNPEYCRNEYRLRLDAAINQLPPLQRSIMEVIRNGFPIESKDPGAASISKTLQKAEKTIRNQRNKAIESLREALKISSQP